MCCIESVPYVLYKSKPAFLLTISGLVGLLMGVSLSAEDPLFDSLYLCRWERVERLQKTQGIWETHAVQEGPIVISQ
jgi:hypothetical protein